MSSEVMVTFHCDCPCGDQTFDNKLSCFKWCMTSYHRWEPDGVNDTPPGWHSSDEDDVHYCDPCWNRITGEEVMMPAIR